VRGSKIHRRLRPRPSLARLQLRAEQIRYNLERLRCKFRLTHQALNNARNVYINRNLAPTKGDRCNRSRRVWPYPREKLQRFVRRWQPTCGMRRLRRSVQREGATVISEATPRLKYLCRLGFSECGKCWESSEEPLGELIDTRDLRLLRHYLNDEHRVGVAPLANLQRACTLRIPSKEELVDSLNLLDTERHGAPGAA